LTAGVAVRHPPLVKPRSQAPDDDIDLPLAEIARDRRRDHDLRAVEREGMRTGLAKQFKQVLDSQAKRAAEAERELEELWGGEKAHNRPVHDRGRKRPTQADRDPG